MMAATVKRLGQFMTPAWAARRLWAEYFADVGPRDMVLEPSCGDGRCLQAVPAAVPAIGVDICARMVRQAKARTGRPVIHGDALTVALPRCTVVFGNPPFRSAFLDGLLARLVSLMPEGGRCGLIVPAYFFQSESTVLRWNQAWTIKQELLPRTLFDEGQLLTKPITFSLFTRDSRPHLIGFRLYHERAAIEELRPDFRAELKHGRGLWAVVVARALTELGGRAHVQQIYVAVAVARPTENRWWRQKIRQTLQRGFRRASRGVWELPKEEAA